MSDTPTLYRDAPQTDHRCFIKQPNHKHCWICASVRKFVVPVEPSNLAAVLMKQLPLISASQIVEVCNAFFEKVPDDEGLTLKEAAIDTDEPDVPPAGWHICDCSEDCGAWEPDGE